MAQKGVSGFTLSDVLAMGFDTSEFTAMLRFEWLTNGRDRVRSEDELNALMEFDFGSVNQPVDRNVIEAVLAARIAKAESDREVDEREAAERHEAQVREYARY